MHYNNEKRDRRIQSIEEFAVLFINWSLIMTLLALFFLPRVRDSKCQTVIISGQDFYKNSPFEIRKCRKTIDYHCLSVESLSLKCDRLEYLLRCYQYIILYLILSGLTCQRVCSTSFTCCPANQVKFVMKATESGLNRHTFRLSENPLQIYMKTRGRMLK